MKIFNFLLSLTVSLALIFVLHKGIGDLPPLGRLLDPYGGFWQNSGNDDGMQQESYELDGLGGEVSVLYDSLMVPHIIAQNDEDLYYIQGYITARHRLWQMDLQTRAAAGKLSEVLGEKTIEFDRRQRRIGMVRAAEKSLTAMMADPVSAMVVKQYTAGINAYISELKYKNYPLEYKLMNFYPEPWTELKSALLLKYMANMLSGYENDLEYTNALKIFGEDAMAVLYPQYYPNQQPIVPTGTIFEGNVILPENENIIADVKGISSVITDKPDPNNGSNNWAVAGSRTANGKPILCNDPHLGLNLPALWFQVQLTAPGINCYGVSLPGAPCIIIGFNDSIAWGVTNSERDVRDWYNIKFKDDNRSEYSYDNNWMPTKKVVEKIKVKGHKALHDTIVFTHLGPIVFDRNFELKDKPQHQRVDLALKWQAMEPSNELMTLYKLNRGKNYTDYEKALVHFECPAQNFVFASASGDIAIWNQGRYPVRAMGHGKYLLDGSTSATAWKHYIPQSENPHIVNPQRGYVSSANQHPTDQTYPYYYSGVFEYFRNRRINNLLDSLQGVTASDMMRMQNDKYNMTAAEMLPVMLRAMQNVKLDPARGRVLRDLNQWNYMNDAQQVAPVYFEAWWDAFNSITWDEYQGQPYPLTLPSTATTLALALADSSNIFFDVKHTAAREGRSEVIIMAFTQAMDSLDNWQRSTGKPLTWQYYSGLRVTHLARLEAFSYTDLPSGGNKHIVNAARNTHGPSWRMIVELTTPVRAWGVYPGGQSGNPGSPYYANMLQKWVAGEYYNLVFIHADNRNEKSMISTQNFKAKSK